MWNFCDASSHFDHSACWIKIHRGISYRMRLYAGLISCMTACSGVLHRVVIKWKCFWLHTPRTSESPAVLLTPSCMAYVIHVLFWGSRGLLSFTLAQELYHTACAVFGSNPLLPTMFKNSHFPSLGKRFLTGKLSSPWQWTASSQRGGGTTSLLLSGCCSCGKPKWMRIRKP